MSACTAMNSSSGCFWEGLFYWVVLQQSCFKHLFSVHCKQQNGVLGFPGALAKD